jgi:hypothetical protein
VLELAHDRGFAERAMSSDWETEDRLLNTVYLTLWPRIPPVAPATPIRTLLLPFPFGPMMATDSPSPMVKVASWTATTCP